MSRTGDQLSLLILCRQALRQSSALAIRVTWRKSTLFLPGTDCEKIFCKGAESPFKFPGCGHSLARTRGSDVSWARIHFICSESCCTSHKFKSQRSHTDESFNVLAQRIAALDGVAERLRFLLITEDLSFNLSYTGWDTPELHNRRETSFQAQKCKALYSLKWRYTE